MIPKIVHQIWVGKFEMPDREKRFVSDARDINKSFEHVLWTDNNLPELPPKVKELSDYFSHAENYALQADILRVFLVKKYGGIYVDVDMKPRKSMEEIELGNHDAILFYHDELSSPNTAFGGGVECEVMNYLCEGLNNSWNGPSWFDRRVKEFLSKKGNLQIQEHHDKNYLSELEKNRIKAMRWMDFHEYFYHHGLDSWSEGHKNLFLSGQINYDTRILI